MNSEALKETRRDLHKIPELGFQETKTQEYLLNFIEELPQDHIEVKKWRTGLLVKVRGTDPSKTIAYRADIDGLPIVEETGYPFASTHEGQMHACGHDFHMTIALGSLARLAKSPAREHVLFLFQPAEENPGGALPMLQSEEMKSWWPDEIFALHIAPEHPVGSVATKEGLLFANTSELYIDFKGKGGHAAYPHLTRDMVLAASQYTVQAQSIVSRAVDPLDSAVVTIGKITGGTVQNGIAETARLEGTMRTFKADTMDLLKKKIEDLAKGIEFSHDCEISIDYGSNYYQVNNHGAYIEPFQQIVEDLGYTFVESKAAMTGEDFGYMLKEIPGFMFWLGVDSEYGLHNGRLEPKEEALEVGVNVVERTLRSL
ncbi:MULTISPECIES: N-acetyldiaminopimelate deacetylase [Pontibacillus]|uniref:N-acetyldiaminopimelate deacetylase n=1 Tax=Pontibacillus chungwhensis TaxID=265426 RepID=A0ABY8V2S9_9BACI|nr:MULTISPECIES: N-acetyldiaminopimelate deacetylase [Pontibacillus]MCD5322503.1 N-acetyldiaminopimelate deacetylase [Pontibacillus sp. HN14]WIF99788.1 N-acetyldiaminopimelate deacetylase [Pontibacillus chungwhensis]